MPTTLSLRRAQLSDIDQIVAIEELSFGAEAFNRRQFKRLVSCPSGIFTVAISGSSVAGYLILLTRRNSRMIRVYSIAVSPNHRGLGIAQELLRYTRQVAVELGKTAISLEVSEGNAPAISLYLKQGFVATGRKANYYGEGNHALVMRLALGT